MSKDLKAYDTEKKHSSEELKEMCSYVRKFFFAALEKEIANKLREQQLDEREKKIKKQEDEQETNKK